MATKPKTKRAKAKAEAKAEAKPLAINPLWQAFEAVVATNNALTGIAPIFKGHYFNAEAPQEAGLQPLIGLILINAGAFGPVNAAEVTPAPGTDANSPEFRELQEAHLAAFCAVAFTSEELYAAAVQWFSEDSGRYGEQSFRTVLSRMVRNGLLGSIRIPKSLDDNGKECRTTHAAYWLRTDPEPRPRAKRGFQAAPMPQPSKPSNLPVPA